MDDDETTVLQAIETLRSHPEYRAAEELRRRAGGSAALAAAPEGSAERRAVQLLISTWESIAVLTDGLKKRDRIYAVTPVCHMWRELEAGVHAQRAHFPAYARRFEALYEANQAWLRKQKKDAKYVSAVCAGMYARFG
jgi:hypothetical protein